MELVEIFTPRNLTEAMEWAKMVSDSEICPKDYRGKPGNVLICMAKGAELGLMPLQALEAIAVVNGRAAIWGDSAVAKVRTHPEFVDLDEGFDDARQEAWAVITRRGQTPQRRTFSMAEAINAKLMEKNTPWSSGYAKRMCSWRAKSYAMRDVFPDALRNIGIKEIEETMPQPAEKDITPEKEPLEQLPEQAAGGGTPAPIAKSKADRVMERVTGSRFAGVVPPKAEVVDPKEAAERAKQGFAASEEQLLFNIQEAKSVDEVNLALDMSRSAASDTTRQNVQAAAAKRIRELKPQKEGTP